METPIVQTLLKFETINFINILKHSSLSMSMYRISVSCSEGTLKSLNWDCTTIEERPQDHVSELHVTNAELPIAKQQILVFITATSRGYTTN